MTRSIASLFLLWTLLMGPALCVGGVLDHPCDCGIESDATCEHEESCLDDPCTEALVIEDRSILPDLEFIASLAVVVVDEWHAEPASIWRHGSSPLPLPPDSGHLPFAESDRPLLI